MTGVLIILPESSDQQKNQNQKLTVFGTKQVVWVNIPGCFLNLSDKKCEIITFCRILTIFGIDIIFESLLQ